MTATPVDKPSPHTRHEETPIPGQPERKNSQHDLAHNEFLEAVALTRNSREQDVMRERAELCMQHERTVPRPR